MSLSPESRRIRAVIKRLMKKHGYRYADLARVLKVSVPTVKRIMTRDELALERLIVIADWLAIPLHELIAAAADDPRGASVLTDAQEQLLSSDRIAYIYYHALLTGRPLEDVRARWNLSQREERRVQGVLDDVGLIEVWPGDRLRLRVRGPFNMQHDGPLQRTYFVRVARAIVQRFVSYMGAYHDAESLERPVLFRPFEMVLRPDVYLEMVRELREVVLKYRSRSRSEMTLEALHNLRHVSGVIAADFYYPWDDALTTHGPK
jgi:transcriptional regulator with XRE-family HTH domain